MLLHLPGKGADASAGGESLETFKGLRRLRCGSEAELFKGPMKCE